MESSVAQSCSELVPLECQAEGSGPPERISVERREWLALRWSAGYWKQRHADLKARHEALLTDYAEVCGLNGAQLKLQRKVEKLERILGGLSGVGGVKNIVFRQGRKIKQQQKVIRKLKASLRRWKLKVEEKDSVIARQKRMLFGRSSEKQKSEPKKASSQAADQGRPPRRKAAKKASRKRHDYRHLETVEERHDVEAECSVCGKAYVGNGYEESELIEIEVRAYRRLLRRQRKRSTCQCGGGRELVAPPVPRLFPRTRYGVGFWAHYLFQRFSMHQTVGGFCRWSESHGVALSKSTLVNRNAAFQRLFEALHQAIVRRQGEKSVLHGDETSWPVQLAGIPKGESYRGWLWICVSEDCVSVHIDRHRSAEAAYHLFADRSEDKQRPVLVCDRYSAYKKLARELGYLLAFCWAHQRRDFIDAAAAQDESMQRWLESWLKRFGKLFHLNKQRVKAYDPALPMSQQSKRFVRLQSQLEDSLKRFFDRVKAQQQQLSANSAKAQPLNSALRHEQGLRVFETRPEVAMDNNISERTLRLMVILRLLSRGSKGMTGVRLSACMWSVIETLRLHDLNLHAWLSEYLGACADNGGKAPADVERWLPWRMDEEHLSRLRQGGGARPQGP